MRTLPTPAPETNTERDLDTENEDLRAALDTGPHGLTDRLELLARVLRCDTALGAVDRESLAYQLEGDVRRIRHALKRGGGS